MTSQQKEIVEALKAGCAFYRDGHDSYCLRAAPGTDRVPGRKSFLVPTSRLASEALIHKKVIVPGKRAAQRQYYELPGDSKTGP